MTVNSRDYIRRVRMTQRAPLMIPKVWSPSAKKDIKMDTGIYFYLLRADASLVVHTKQGRKNEPSANFPTRISAARGTLLSELALFQGGYSYPYSFQE